MPRELSDRAQDLLEDFPPFMQSSYEVQAVVDVTARELDRFFDAMETLRNNYWPTRGTEYLQIYEELLDLSVDPLDKTTEQRQQSVLAFYRTLKSSGSRAAWEGAVTALIGSGWSYVEHDPGDPGSPDAYTIAVTIPFASQITIPTGLGATPGGSGSLAAGTYYYAVSAADLYGETQIGSIVSATVGASGRISLNWNDVAGASYYHVYRGASAGTLRRLDTGSPLTTSDYIDTGAATPTTQPPSNTNTTGSYQSHEAHRLLRKITPAHVDLIFSYDAGFIVGFSELGDFL